MIVWVFFKLKVFNLFRTSSGVVGDKKNVFALPFVKKESKVFLAFGTFLSNFPAIDVKNLLKWLAMIWSISIVLLSIFRVNFLDTVLDVLV